MLSTEKPTLTPSSSYRDPSGPERDDSNFDFRVVTLLLILITRQDLLKEYLDDGKIKDDHNVPIALRDRCKWKTLRTLFDPAMLAEMLYLWELPQTQDCALYLRRVFQTMINLEEYDFDGCPNDGFVKAIVEYSKQQTAVLNPAGVATDEGRKN
jgi:hypothetical protein